MENKRALITLLTANVISGFATGISMLAIPWYFTTLGKADTFGILYAVVTLISLPWNLYAGTLIDKFSRKKIFIWISSVCGTILLCVATIGMLLNETLPVLVGLVFVVTLFNFNIHFGALYAFGQEISPPSFYGKISSYLEIQNQSTSVFSGALAAFLLSGISSAEYINLLGLSFNLPFDIKAWTMEEIFFMDACTYAVSIILVSTIKYKPMTERMIESGSVFTRIKSGVEFLKKTPSLLSFGIFSHSIFVVLLVEVFYLLPLYVDQHLQSGADVYASSEVLYSLGAVLAGFSIRKIFLKMNTVNSIIVLLFVTSVIFYWVSFTCSISVFYIFSFLIGITNAGARVLRTTYIFNHIPNNIIGRTNGVFNMINILLRTVFISLFAVSWFSVGSNITWAYFISGTFVLVSGILLLAGSRKYRQAPVFK